jgi:hypothetical protein
VSGATAFGTRLLADLAADFRPAAHTALHQTSLEGGTT